MITTSQDLTGKPVRRTRAFDVLSLALAAAAFLLLGYVLALRHTNRPEYVERAFHMHYMYDHWDNVASDTRWLGAPAMKTPFDLWVYQEIIFDTKPDVLVETGTNRAGSAFYYATLFETLGRGRVYTMDIEDMRKVQHPRINFKLGSSTAPETLDWIRSGIKPGERVMVTLDSLHTKEHVLAELDLYAPLVSKGSYLVVEDTQLNGHPIRFDFSPGPGKQGPWEALEEWLPKHPEFIRDKEREKFGFTCSPGGWLKRMS